MRNYRKKLLLVLAAVIGFFALLGVGGDIDYTDQVILRMSYEEYDTAKYELMKLNGGDVPSEREIVRWWESHHK